MMTTIQSMIRNLGAFYIKEDNQLLFSNGTNLIGGTFHSKSLKANSKIRTPPDCVPIASQLSGTALFKELGVDNANP